MDHQIAPLHFITADRHPMPHLQQILVACRSGVRWIQLRMKHATENELISTAIQARRICSRYRAKLIINDHPEIALHCQADGVHLGQKDMPPATARRMRAQMIIGGTANTPRQALEMAGGGADYIGAGPFRFTQTKQNLAPILGSGGLKVILDELHRQRPGFPVIAVGGITVGDLDLLSNLPLHGIAVSGAIVGATDPASAVHKIINKFNNRKVHVTDR